MTPAQADFLNGHIERVVFYNEENGFAVLRVKNKQQRDLLTVVGNTMSATPGEYIECHGQWIQDKQHGLQFKAERIKVITPTSIAGIEKYLGSGLIKGIGPHFAKKLVAAFQTDVFNVIELEADRLLTIEGIGTFRRDLIVKAWSEQKLIRHIMMFLHQHGVGTSRSIRIYKTYGEKAIEQIESDPYCLARDIHGIGFKTADELAQKLGIEANSPLRIRAAILHLLQTFAADGHCAAKQEALIKGVSELLPVESELVASVLQDEIAAGQVIQEMIDDIPCIFSKALWFAEKNIQVHLTRLMKAPRVWQSIDVSQAIPWVEQKTGLTLSRSQQQAIKTVLNHKVAIITGGPGVGKTTVVNSILRILATQQINIILCAPTGRAAKRLNETTGFPAKTIHRLLGRGNQSEPFAHHKGNPLAVDLLVVDESSMIDVILFYHLLKALPDKAGLLLVGDVDQLPSVGPGAVLTDLIASNQIATARLTEIFRQAATSKIIVNAHRINEGKMPYSAETSTLTDFYFIESETPEDIQHKLLQVVCERIPKRFQLDPIQEVQVLTPMNRSSLGAYQLNALLQKALNPQPTLFIEKFGWRFSIGDKVMQLTNNYDKEVFNGDVGFIQHIDLEESLMQIQFDQRLIDYDISELDEIALAYAVTIHKSQGSEYPAVVIPIAMQHFMLLQKNLLYTAVTRGKKLVVLIGQKKALAMTVHNRKAQHRLTHLAQRI